MVILSFLIHLTSHVGGLKTFFPSSTRSTQYWPSSCYIAQDLLQELFVFCQIRRPNCCSLLLLESSTRPWYVLEHLTTSVCVCVCVMTDVHITERKLYTCGAPCMYVSFKSRSLTSDKLESPDICFFVFICVHQVPLWLLPRHESWTCLSWPTLTEIFQFPHYHFGFCFLLNIQVSQRRPPLPSSHPFWLHFADCAWNRRITYCWCSSHIRKW